MTFGLATLPIIGGVGAAIDFGHAHAVKSAMQSALDATALMISRDAPTLNETDLQTKVQAYFTAMFNRPEATAVTVSALYTSGAGSKVVVNGSANVATSVMGVLGYNFITINGSSTAKWGTDRLRVALALDVTGSMASAGKLAALKSATKSLLTQLKNAGTVDGDVYVSIIPFNKDVNVGASNYNATWLDWTAWDAANSSSGAMVGSICYNGTLWETDASGWRNSGPCSGTGGGVCYQGTLWKYNGNWYSAGGCTHQTWNGCVSDRGSSSGPHADEYDRKVTEPSTSIRASLWPAEQYGSCPAPMKGLSYEWDGDGHPGRQPAGRRQHQSADRARLGVAVTGRRRPSHRSCQGSELYLQRSHRPDVGRPEYAEPLEPDAGKHRQAHVRRRQCRHRDMRLHQESRDHYLHGARQHRRRPEIDAARELRQPNQQVLDDHAADQLGNVFKTDRHQHHASCASPYRRGQRKSPAQPPGLLPQQYATLQTLPAIAGARVTSRGRTCLRTACRFPWRGRCTAR